MGSSIKGFTPQRNLAKVIESKAVPQKGFVSYRAPLSMTSNARREGPSLPSLRDVERESTITRNAKELEKEFLPE